MRRLTLVRHAKSAWDEPELRDFDRPLNHRGRRDAPRVATHLLDLVGVPDRLVSSPARRALSTARVFAATFDIAEEAIVLDARIYEASVPTLLRVIEDFDARDRHVMLFGHNPGLSELAHHLARCAFDTLPTCAAVQIELAIEDWTDIAAARGRLLHYVYPKGLSAPE